MLNHQRLVWILDVLLNRGCLHAGQRQDVLNRGEDQARHIMLDKRAELRRLLGKRRVVYRVSEMEVIASFRFRFVDDKGEMLRSRPNTPDQPGRKRQRTLDIEKYRVEVCVVAFARTLDYYGFFGIYGMYKTQLARSERHQLSERIGSSLLFRLSPR